MRKLLIAGALIAGAAASADAATIFGVNGDNELVSFNSATPGTILSRVKIRGGGSTVIDTIKAIDFRLADGGLYGLTTDRSLVKISLSGFTTVVATNLPVSGSEFGFDFNQSIDRIRLVSNENNNYVVNPADGSVTNVTNVAYTGTRVPDADVVASAYTPSTGGTPAMPGSATQLYGIDSRNDRLVTQANNAGTLATVGQLRSPANVAIDVSSRTSFDIARDGVGYVFDTTRLYSVNLTNGQLSLLGQTPESLFAISVGDTIAAAVPEPATWAMMIGGVGLVGGALRRSRRQGRVLATA